MLPLEMWSARLLIGWAWWWQYKGVIEGFLKTRRSRSTQSPERNRIQIVSFEPLYPSMPEAIPFFGPPSYRDHKYSLSFCFFKVKKFNLISLVLLSNHCMLTYSASLMYINKFNPYQKNHTLNCIILNLWLRKFRWKKLNE